MNRMLGLTVAATLALGATVARADDTRGFYLGVNIGATKMDIDKNAYDAALNDALAQSGVTVTSATSSSSENDASFGVFAGYRNSEEDADAFTDGFFRTGDLGELDTAGRLTLWGRCKDVIVTSGGKNVSPAAWEGSVERNPLVAHAVLIGEGKPYLGGLILLDPESVNAWAEREGLASSVRLTAPVDGGLVQVDDSHLLAAVGRAVQAANTQLARSEQVRRFSLLIADLTEKGGIVTPTLKLKRAALMARGHDIIESLYRDPRSHP